MYILEHEKFVTQSKDSSEKTNFSSSSEHSLLDSSRLNPKSLKKLTSDQQNWLHEKIYKSQLSHNNYSCQICSKVLKSHLAILYHIKNRHLLKQLSEEQIWVANNIKKGIRCSKNAKGEKVTTWLCTECKKEYSYQSGIRYHLTLHLKNNDTLRNSLK